MAMIKGGTGGILSEIAGNAVVGKLKWHIALN